MSSRLPLEVQVVLRPTVGLTSVSQVSAATRTCPDLSTTPGGGASATVAVVDAAVSEVVSAVTTLAHDLARATVVGLVGAPPLPQPRPADVGLGMDLAARVKAMYQARGLSAVDLDMLPCGSVVEQRRRAGGHLRWVQDGEFRLTGVRGGTATASAWRVLEAGSGVRGFRVRRSEELAMYGALRLVHAPGVPRPSTGGGSL